MSEGRGPGSKTDNSPQDSDGPRRVNMPSRPSRECPPILTLPEMMMNIWSPWSPSRKNTCPRETSIGLSRSTRALTAVASTPWNRAALARMLSTDVPLGLILTPRYARDRRRQIPDVVFANH
jgi:hypothetical protein